MSKLSERAKALCDQHKSPLYSVEVDTDLLAELAEQVEKCEKALKYYACNYDQSRTSAWMGHDIARQTLKDLES